MANKNELNNSVLGAELRRLRVNRGYTQTKVAEYLNISRTTYTKYEGGREPDLDALRSLARFYDISLDELISGSYSENNGRIAIARSAQKDPNDDEFYPLSKEEKQLVSIFRTCSHPRNLLNFAKKLYHDDITEYMIENGIKSEKE